MIWRRRARRRPRARHKQVRRRTAGGGSVAAGDDPLPPGQFDGYAVELLDAVARLLGVRLEYYAVPSHAAAASSAATGGRAHDYGMWSALVEQLLAEASSDSFAQTSHHAHQFSLCV